MIRLNPYTVKAEYPSVEVRFKLTGQNLFEPLDDPILRADISAINDHGGSTRNEIELGDRLIAINGTELSGLSLNQIATVLTEARQAGVPVWQVRRGLQILHIYFGGDWEPALPGLKR